VKRIEALDAKTHLSTLLDRVAKGEQIMITRNGIPVAVLMPVDVQRSGYSHKEIVERLRALRKRVRPGKVSVREMVTEGRRF
jgi:prevent-host-death family protein